MNLVSRIATIGALSVAAVACSAARATPPTFEPLPTDVFVAVRTPGELQLATATPDTPLIVVVQLDPRVVGSNCSLEIVVGASDDSGAYAERRVASFEPPLQSQVMTFEYDVELVDVFPIGSPEERPMGKPFTIPGYGEYVGLVRARLLAPDPSDPTYQFTDREQCRDVLDAPTGDEPGLSADRYFTLRFVEDLPDPTTTATGDTAPGPETTGPALPTTIGGGSGGSGGSGGTGGGSGGGVSTTSPTGATTTAPATTVAPTTTVEITTTTEAPTTTAEPTTTVAGTLAP